MPERVSHGGTPLQVCQGVAHIPSTSLPGNAAPCAPSPGVLEEATRKPSTSSARAGVEARWVECPLRSQAEPRHQACIIVPLRLNDAFLMIVPTLMGIPANLRNILGDAWVNSEESPNRFYFRHEHARRTALAHRQASESRLLGQVMAHE